MMYIDAVLDRVRGHSSSLQLRGEFVRVVLSRERANELIDCRGVLDPRSRSLKARIGGIGRKRGEHRAPLLVVRDGNRDPSLVTVLVGASIGAVRSITCGRVAARLEH